MLQIRSFSPRRRGEAVQVVIFRYINLRRVFCEQVGILSLLKATVVDPQRDITTVGCIKKNIKMTHCIIETEPKNLSMYFNKQTTTLFILLSSFLVV